MPTTTSDTVEVYIYETTSHGDSPDVSVLYGEAEITQEEYVRIFKASQVPDENGFTWWDTQEEEA